MKTSRSPRLAARPAPAPRGRGLARTGALPWMVVVVAGAGASGGCADENPDPTIAAVRPASAFSDVPVTLLVDAPALHPGLSVDVDTGDLALDDGAITMSLVPDSDDGRPIIDLARPEWLSTTASYLTTVPAGQAQGGYALAVVPPDGRRLTLGHAFQILGPDTTAPDLRPETPHAGDTIVAGTPTPLSFDADDGVGQLRAVTWQTADGVSGSCLLPPDQTTAALPSAVHCGTHFVAPALPPGAGLTTPLSVTLTAVDVAGNTRALEIPLFVSKLPVIGSFTGTVGALKGNQPFKVVGHFFLPGSQAFIGNTPIMGMTGRAGGDLIDDMTITGMTPPHARAELLIVDVVSPAGFADAPLKFAYVDAPRPRDVQPPTGPPGGGIPVTIRGNDLRAGVMLSFGLSAADARPLAGPVGYAANDKVTGCLPPGTGTVSIFAHDPVTGDGALVGAFTYDAGDGTAPDPSCSQAAAP